MLGRLGLRVVHGPTIRTLPLVDDGRLHRLSTTLIDKPPDYLVANTGIGMRAWLGMAASWGIDQALVEALGRASITARGPKAAGAVLTAGLEVCWSAPSEQLAEVTQWLLTQPLDGRRVAVQLHGDEHQPLTATLRAAGAEVVEVPVYRWTLPDDTQPALRLVELICGGAIDVTTFTCGPALRNLYAIARSQGLADRLTAAFNNGAVAACIGPVCAQAALDEGIQRPVVPDRWRLGSLVRAVAEELEGRRAAYRLGVGNLVLQGSMAVVDGTEVRLTERERGVLSVLADHAGATVPRTTLLHRVWGDRSTDPHALEVVVGRLRSKMGPAGESIETTVRRGYRLVATPLDAGTGDSTSRARRPA